MPEPVPEPRSDVVLPTPRFIDEPVAWWAEHTPDAEAVSYLERTWTWREWEARVRRAAGALRGLGVGRGDVVAFLDKNHPACVELSLAAGSLGAANAIVNWRLAGDEVDYTVNDCGAKVLVVGSDLMPLVTSLRDRLPAVEHVVEVTPGGGPHDAYERLLAEATPTQRGRGFLTRRRVPGDILLRHHGSAQGDHADPYQHGAAHAQRPRWLGLRAG
ncbi:MAG: AMP-binding protein [Nocardioides sp.]